MIRSVPILIAVLLSAAPATAALPPVPVPPENPITEEKRVLGKILFWDEQLSSDNSMACGSCHLPASGGADPAFGRHPGLDQQFLTGDDVFGSKGVVRRDPAGGAVPDPQFGFDRQVTGRAAPSMFVAAFAPEILWDGSASGTFHDPETGQMRIANGGALETQAVLPLLNPAEMATEGRTWADVTGRLATVDPLALATDLPADVSAALLASPTYPQLFQAAFGTPDITATRIAFAIATYQRTLIPDQTPWDLHDAGDPSALTTSQIQGLSMFMATTCRTCHNLPFFTDHTFRNTGLRPIAEDPGRQFVTGAPADAGAFKVPSLRNVGLKRTFMHHGRLTDLAQVLDFYRGVNGQVQFTENQDPHVPLVDIPEFGVDEVLDFLTHGLTDPRVAAETFPFDRPTLASERVTAAGSASTTQVHPSPNPFVARTSFRLELAQPGPIRLRIHDLRGRVVSDQRIQGIPGRQRIEWDGQDASGSKVAAGVYRYVLDSPNRRSAGTLLLTR